MLARGERGSLLKVEQRERKLAPRLYLAELYGCPISWIVLNATAGSVVVKMVILLCTRVDVSVLVVLQHCADVGIVCGSA